MKVGGIPMPMGPMSSPAHAVWAPEAVALSTAASFKFSTQPQHLVSLELITNAITIRIITVVAYVILMDMVCPTPSLLIQLSSPFYRSSRPSPG